VKTASLYDFVLTGRLGYLSCGMEESEVIRIVGEPDGTVKHLTTFHAFYGCLNLQYSSRKRITVVAIQMENAAYPIVCPAIELDPWRIRKRMSHREFTEMLDHESKEYCEQAGEQIKWIRTYTDSRVSVEAAFQAEMPEPYSLWSLSAVDHGELCFC
jgi:hypothetical protein